MATSTHEDATGGITDEPNPWTHSRGSRDLGIAITRSTVKESSTGRRRVGTWKWCRPSIQRRGLWGASISRPTRRSTVIISPTPLTHGQQYVPYGTQTRPAQAARVRGRAARGTRVYSRGYNQAPAPYATQLPRGQLAVVRLGDGSRLHAVQPLSELWSGI